MASPPSGIGVDRSGGPVIDPTKNVETLVEANAKFQDAMRGMEAKYQNDMRQAETRRLDDLASLRADFNKQISDILTVQVKTTSDLISTQLDKVTSALGDQIRSLSTQLLDRIGQLERFRWEVGGRTSVQDPAMSQALTSMANAIATLQSGTSEGHGRQLGRGEVLAYVVAAVAVGGLLLTLIAHFRP